MPELRYDEGCPIIAADYWDGGACPQCGATESQESCINWAPTKPLESKTLAEKEN